MLILFLHHLWPLSFLLDQNPINSFPCNGLCGTCHPPSPGKHHPWASPSHPLAIAMPHTAFPGPSSWSHWRHWPCCFQEKREQLLFILTSLAEQPLLMGPLGQEAEPLQWSADRSSPSLCLCSWGGQDRIRWVSRYSFRESWRKVIFRPALSCLKSPRWHKHFALSLALSIQFILIGTLKGRGWAMEWVILGSNPLWTPPGRKKFT